MGSLRRFSPSLTDMYCFGWCRHLCIALHEQHGGELHVRCGSFLEVSVADLQQSILARAHDCEARVLDHVSASHRTTSVALGARYSRMAEQLAGKFDVDNLEQLRTLLDSKLPEWQQEMRHDLALHCKEVPYPPPDGGVLSLIAAWEVIALGIARLGQCVLHG